MKRPLAALAVLISLPAAAIELSLEENRAERGSVGFIDMQRLFAGSPDAQRAKEAFQELVRQAEDKINAKKAEVIKLRQELDALEARRAELAASTPTAPSPKAPPPAPAPETKPEPPAAPSTGAARALALPGMTPIDSAPAAPPEAKPEPAPAPKPDEPTAAQRLVQLDGLIAAMRSDVERKEAEVKRERLSADKGLIDVENRRTDQVLARLYRAVSEVSRKEGISVVVDKSAILYGHPAMDLTDKVLKHMRGPQP